MPTRGLGARGSGATDKRIDMGVESGDAVSSSMVQGGIIITELSSHSSYLHQMLNCGSIYYCSVTHRVPQQKKKEGF